MDKTNASTRAWKEGSGLGLLDAPGPVFEIHFPRVLILAHTGARGPWGPVSSSHLSWELPLTEIQGAHSLVKDTEHVCNNSFLTFTAPVLQADTSNAKVS
jgi:hypothetical protein